MDVTFWPIVACLELGVSLVARGLPMACERLIIPRNCFGGTNVRPGSSGRADDPPWEYIAVPAIDFDGAGRNERDRL